MRSLVVLLALLPLSVHAQEGEWTYSANIYAWIPGLDASVQTPLGELNSRSSGGNVLDNLDMAFMGTFEARRDKWGLLFDGVYAKLSTSKDTPFGLAFSQGEIATELSAVSGYALYRSYDTERLTADIGLGLRAFDVDLDIGLDAGQIGGDRAFGGSKSWVVPLVAGRFTAPISEKWFATAYFDYGQTSGDDTTWQGVATIGYRFNERWAVQGGYRHMELEQEIGGLDSDISLSGPVIGLNFRF
ncbi:hypothetical protein [Paracoccus aestuariivivens]|uniref:Outer membrane beta-barrel protein n=1 Tax=Paracoccus aestuariivivens TaxID=1820333 RepID=A0A6L6JDU9_9RHOB|nr:hypothetical protein [Paracoccus aestuariivivens]MTH79696.1 hypothetical protein [Paracoccus aestuariivivens]